MKNYFGGGEKLFREQNWSFFKKRKRLAPNNELNFFYHKLGTEYFIISVCESKKVPLLKSSFWRYISFSEVGSKYTVFAIL